MLSIAIFAGVAVIAVLMFIAYNALVLDRENKWLWTDRERLQDERDHWKYERTREYYEEREFRNSYDDNGK